MSTRCADPVHDQSGPTTYWTRVNVQEAIPGVLTPLGWSLWREAEVAGRRSFCMMGVLPRCRLAEPGSADEMLMTTFFGRAALNVDFMRHVGDLTPGSSGDAVEEQYFGSVRSGVPTTTTNRRLPFVASRLPPLLLLEPRRLHRLLDEQRNWWRANTLPGAGQQRDGGGLLREARDRFALASRHHAFGTMFASLAFNQLSKLAQAAGEPGLETQLATGYGGLEEFALVADLWAVSRGEIVMAEFLAQHGFHGPDEGQLQSRSWREDPSPVEALAVTYRSLDDTESPAAAAAGRAQIRLAGERTVLAGVPRAKRAQARVTLRMARSFVPLREVGKAAFLMAIDVARVASQARGRELVELCVLDDPDDVYFLTVDELLASHHGELRSVVAERRARHERYVGLSLPRVWTGQPSPMEVEPSTEPLPSESAVLKGISITPGVVEAIARVAEDFNAALYLQPGEVLVCRTTDPSWAPVFPIAGALVIDVGGPMSHGAIVARELGTPCVIGTGTAIRDVPDGALVRVDAGSGSVEVLSVPGEA
ncbi:MAG: PEP-utilizing enzyme [Actinomycetota bacterium]